MRKRRMKDAAAKPTRIHPNLDSQKLANCELPIWEEGDREARNLGAIERENELRTATAFTGYIDTQVSPTEMAIGGNGDVRNAQV